MAGQSPSHLYCRYRAGWPQYHPPKHRATGPGASGFGRGLLSDAQNKGGEGAWGTIEVANGGVGELVLIEHNPDDIKLTLRTFQRARFVNPVRVARDGQEALALLFGSDDTEPRALLPVPQLVRLELNPLKADGLDVPAADLGRLRSHRIPVVVLTSSRERTTSSKATTLA